MLLGISKVHFIGIGGVGMSGIAEILNNLGFIVSGSDIERSEITDRLVSLGITVKYGHDEKNVPNDIDIVVYTSAVSEDNVEMLKARKENIPVIKRAEILAELMRIKDGIAIAGSHGKSTTTALCGKVFIDCGMDPTVVIGGRFDYIKGNAKLGEGDFFIAEADESDKSFLLLSPIINIITSIDNDHLENYGSMENLLAGFTDFANKVPFFGFNILNMDDENIQKLFPKIKTKIHTYGFKNPGEFRADNVSFSREGSKFSVYRNDTHLGDFEVPYPGEHYISNALAVIALSHLLGLNMENVRNSIDSYAGLGRRMEKMGFYEDAVVYNDYGHHPTEIKFTLNTFSRIKKGRLITFFQPHRYTRTKALMEDFARSFYSTDLLYVADIYPASEKPIKGVDSRVLTEKIREFGKKEAHYINGTDPVEVLKDIKPGKDDIILFLGAGDYYRYAIKMLDDNK